MQRIAYSAGYGSERTLRRSLRHAHGTSPSHYRRRTVTAKHP